MVTQTSPPRLLKGSKKINADKERQEWLQAIEELAQQTRQWAEKQGWPLLETPEDAPAPVCKEINEPPLGTYTVPVLQWQLPDSIFRQELDAGEPYRSPNGYRHDKILMLDPQARFIGGYDGLVDLLDYPGSHKVRLLHNKAEDTWTVRTLSGIDWPFAWNEETFVELAKRLTNAP